MMPTTKEGSLFSYLSLFSSVGTLLCCALPSLFVLFGLGATVATLLSSAPWLIALSRHKRWVFVLSGALIAANFLYIYKLGPKVRDRATCLPDAPGTCDTVSRVSRAILWVSAALYLLGFFTAYLLGPFLAGA